MQIKATQLRIGMVINYKNDLYRVTNVLHITPGNCYENAENGNRSAIHWDLVYIQIPEYGGGEIWFDDTLVRKDGRFVPEPLRALNPENLV